MRESARRRAGTNPAIPFGIMPVRGLFSAQVWKLEATAHEIQYNFGSVVKSKG